MKLTNWKMDYEGYRSLDCVAPCDMYSVLLQHGLISDPYYGTNEETLTDLSKNDCTFYSSFSLTDDELNREKIDLNFYGLDTICHIYLNGTLLGKVMNMHRMYSYDVKSLVGKENEIRLEFTGPIKYFEEMENMHHLYMDGAAVTGASHLRKALYMSGWDWAPRVPNMGIFRPVELCAYDGDKIEDTEITQHHENGQVVLEIKADTKHRAQGLAIYCEVDGQRIRLENGKGEITIKNPRLWWPNNLGEQNLYDVTFELCQGDKVIDTQTKTIGLRTIVLCRENDEYGQEFCFSVNGVKVFAMGANYVPMDSIPTRETPERLERLIKDCIFAHVCWILCADHCAHQGGDPTRCKVLLRYHDAPRRSTRARRTPPRTRRGVVCTGKLFFKRLRYRSVPLRPNCPCGLPGGILSLRSPKSHGISSHWKNG